MQPQGTSNQDRISQNSIGASDLITAIEQFLNDICNIGQFNIRFSTSIAEEVAGVLSEDKQAALFQILQEAMNNVLRHSRAGIIRISFMQHRSGVVLYVFDDGIGFDLQHTKRGVGLATIYATARLFNGLVDIITAPGNGCTLTVLIPYD